MKIKTLATVLALSSVLSVAGCGNAGNTAGYAGNSVVNGVQRGAQTVGNAAGRVGNGVGEGLRRGANAVGNTAGLVGNAVGQGVRGTANVVGNAAGTVGNGVANTTRRGANAMQNGVGAAGNRAAGAVGTAGGTAAGAAGAVGADTAFGNLRAPGQSMQVNSATKTVDVWISDVNNRRAGAGMGLLGRNNAAATGMTLSIPVGWTVRVTTQGSNMGAVAVVPYRGTPGTFGNNTGGVTTSSSTVSKSGGANHQQAVFHAHTAGQYALITSGSAVQNNVWDLITVTKSTTLPSISSSYTS